VAVVKEKAESRKQKAESRNLRPESGNTETLKY
jgi:hypothetical protein